MATVATSKIIDIQQILKHFEENGSSDSDQFIAGAIQELDNDNGQFATNIEDVAVWAVTLDEAFDKVTRTFATLVEEFGSDFPDLVKFFSEWQGYNKRWVDNLNNSRTVASKQIALLNRFDKVFIELINLIETDRDRSDAIGELDQFLKEDHEETDLSQGFLNLKRDIEAFVGKFDEWIKKTGEELAKKATQLQQDIQAIQSEIEKLDKEIKAATITALSSAAGASTMIGIIGLIVAGSALAILIGQRLSKAKDLSDKQEELAIVNRQQKALANIKSSFDGLKPDNALICEKLVLFAEIWSSIRSQTVQFQETLKEGMEAATSVRLKLELKLARELCTPLVVGLEKYATALAKGLKRA